MRGLLVVALVGCSKQATELPPVLASCDRTSQDFHYHRCTDVFDATAIDAWAAACGAGFQRGKACPPSERAGGCLELDGSITRTYEGEASCLYGQAFGDQPPAVAARRPYQCPMTERCFETTSVFDFTTKDEIKNCADLGGKLSAGACPTTNAIGRCAIGERLRYTTLIYYPPTTLADAKQLCAVNHGTWL